MVSINNTVANSAVLASLRKINSDIAVNQTRIGTGLKISKSSDNPALFATAQGIRSDIRAQEKLSADIGISKARADAAVAGLDKITEIVNKIKDISADATANNAAGSTLTAATGKIAAYLTQIGAIASASGFQGKNFLNSAVAENVKLSSETGAQISFTGEVFASQTDVAALIGASNTTLAHVTAIDGLADTALEHIATLQASVTAFSETLGSQLDFQTTLKGINETALSSIVDANMEEESAKSAALQVKQQLAYQALAIGNNSAQNVLLLFR